MKILRGTPENPENNDDCRVLAPFVMTLFDGEADEIEARRARAHLLVCQTCARRWLDWNRSRDLLQSAPVPIPPPQLLWRVLMACRLALKGERPGEKSQKTEIPLDLGAQILTRTTRAAQFQALRPTRRAVLLPKISVLTAPALVAPALAVWLMVLQRDAWLPSTIAPSSAPLAAPARRQISSSGADAPRVISSPPIKRRSRARISNSTLSLLSNRDDRTGAGGAAVPMARLTFAPPKTIPDVPDSPSRSLWQDATTKMKSAGARASNAKLPQSEILLTYARFQADSNRAPQLARVQNQPIASLRAAPAFSPSTGAVPRSLQARFTVSRSSHREPRLRAAVYAPLPANAEQAPDLRQARSQMTVSATSLSGKSSSAPQLLRVSLPSASVHRPARLLAENFDADDERIEEVRSVVDEFRATLGPDEASEDFSSDEISG